MTLPRLYQMYEYWQHSPPIHKMIAAYFGIKKKPKTVSIAELNPDWED